MDELKTVNELLEEEIENCLEYVGDLAPQTDEYSKAADNIVKLYKLKIEEDKNEKDRKDQNIHRVIGHILEGASIVLPLGFYAFWMKRGFKFEETGTFTSNTFRGLISNFKPRRK